MSLFSRCLKFGGSRKGKERERALALGQSAVTAASRAPTCELKELEVAERCTVQGSRRESGSAVGTTESGERTRIADRDERIRRSQVHWSQVSEAAVDRDEEGAAEMDNREVFKSISELSTLRDIRPAQICPSFTDSLTLQVEVFVTRDDAIKDFTQFDSKILEFDDTCTDKQDASKDVSCVNTISCLTPSTSSQNLFMVAIILASVAGFGLMSGLFNLYVYAPRNSAPSRFPMALDVFLFFISTGVGIIVCGGAVLLLWNPAWNCVNPSPPALPNLSPTNLTAQDSRKDAKRNMDLEAQPATLMDMCTITKGPRPQFQEIFENAATRYRGEETGVLICGPRGLQESVALECRSQNFRNRQPQFHFHSVSFDL